MAASRERRVCMAHSSLLIETANSHPKYTGRASLISSLIEAYHLHKHIKLISPQPSPFKELTLFHSSDYITYIQSHSTDSNGSYNSDINEDETATDDEYGLSYDCPIFPDLYTYISVITGATVTMVRALVNGETDVAINWYGGWHHGQKDVASGFCYCNDIVIGILYLLKHYHRVLYIDIDIHHGDGVQDAFSYSSKVLTLSFHKYSPGFYPGKDSFSLQQYGNRSLKIGTGAVDDTGSGRGQYYSINVPLWDGINDKQYVCIFKSIVHQVYVRYLPQVVILQCGADCLSGDPLGGFNLSLHSIGECLQVILRWKIPTLLLGGGGYNFPNTARLWTYLTSLTVGQELSLDIPDHKYFTSYGPDYQLQVDTSNCKSCATDSQVTQLIETLISHIQHVST